MEVLSVKGEAESVRECERKKEKIEVEERYSKQEEIWSVEREFDQNE